MALPFSRKSLTGTPGLPPGFRAISGNRGPRETASRPQHQNTFIFNILNKLSPPFLPPGRPWRGKTGLPPFLAPGVRRRRHGCSAFPSMTQNLHSRNPTARTRSAPLRHHPPQGKEDSAFPLFHQKRRPSTEPGKAAFSLLKRRIKAGKRRPCPEGTWRSGASAGRRRPRPPLRDPERPSSRWKLSFLPRPSAPLRERP